MLRIGHLGLSLSFQIQNQIPRRPTCRLWGASFFRIDR